MLFFRFDFKEENFIGENHKSVLYGEDSREMLNYNMICI